MPDELIDELLVLVGALGRSAGGILFESLHGAPKNGDATAAAVGFRGAAFNISAQAVWQDVDADEEEIGAEPFERLRRLKARFDPDNVLHRNQNIPPAPA